MVEMTSWLEGIGIKSTGTRIDTIKADLESFHPLSSFDSRFFSGSPINKSFYAFSDANSFSRIYRSFKKLKQDHLPKAKIREMLTGPQYSYEEIKGDPNINPRSTQFELEMASSLIDGGCMLQNFEDVTVAYNNFKVSLQCKRPFDFRNVKSSIESAYSQLNKNNNLAQFNNRGFIVLSVEKMYGFDSTVESLAHPQDIDIKIHRLAQEFISDYKSTWTSLLNKNLIGILLMFKIMASHKTETDTVHSEALIQSETVIGIQLFRTGLIEFANQKIFDHFLKIFKG